MSLTQNPKSRFGERVKVALIPILLVLFCVLVFRPKSDNGSTDSDRPAAPIVTRRARPTAYEFKQDAAIVAPPIDVDAVSAFSPFERPNFGRPNGNEPAQGEDLGQTRNTPDNALASGPPSPPEDQRIVTQLQAVFRFENGFAAIVDSAIVRPGDTLDGGLRIVEITAKGIVVEPLR